MSKQKSIPIKGMHCRSCEILIEDELKEIPNIESVQVNHKNGKAVIKYHGAFKEHKVVTAIKDAGYEIGKEGSQPWLTNDLQIWDVVMKSGLIIAGIYLLLTFTGGLEKIYQQGMAATSLPLVFMVGMTAGVSTCMALVGGLVLSMATKFAKSHPQASTTEKLRPQILFNLGRVIGFFILGGIIGVIGSAIQISPLSTGFLTILVGLVMLLFGIQLTNISPKLANISLTLPISLAKALGIHGKDPNAYSDKHTFLMGVASFFLPCGFTQSMQLFAMTTGSFTQAGLVMAVFAAGTIPGLFGIGSLSAFVKGQFAQKFYIFAGVTVVLFALFNISNGLNLTGIRTVLASNYATEDNDVKGVDTEPQIINVRFTRAGLVPEPIEVPAGVPVTLNVDVQADGVGCMSSMTIPGLDNSLYRVKKGQQLTFNFTAPKGKHNITCSMGMLHGSLKAI